MGGQGRRQEALSKMRGISVLHIGHLTLICDEGPRERDIRLSQGSALGS